MNASDEQLMEIRKHHKRRLKAKTVSVTFLMAVSSSLKLHKTIDKEHVVFTFQKDYKSPL